MAFDVLIGELKKMFCHRQSKVTMRRKFEGRLWKKDETFHEYVHEKVILGNRVPIAADEVLDYIIDGIPDSVLRDQARIQRFETTEFLLAAFERVTLRDRQATGAGRQGARNDSSAAVKRGDKSEKNDAGTKKTTDNAKRCYNCGMRDHVSATCPTKELGAKCFECGEHGHITSKCPKKSDKVQKACAVVHSSRNRYLKNVVIEGRGIAALIDTGSDISLMRADEYANIGSPRFQPTDVRFSGVGSENIAALGEFQAEATIDNHVYPILIRVVPDTVSRHKLLIGTDFLDTIELHVKQGVVCINPIREDLDGNRPEVLQINVIDDREINEVDLLPGSSIEAKRVIASLVEGYKPSRTVETNVSMKLVLKDDEPVYQKARRLSPSERAIVNAQIAEWEEQGIVRPSSSDYTSPVVLVRKKDNSHRLCVDYRQLNKKIIKDRYH